MDLTRKLLGGKRTKWHDEEGDLLITLDRKKVMVEVKAANRSNAFLLFAKQLGEHQKLAPFPYYDEFFHALFWYKGNRGWMEKGVFKTEHLLTKNSTTVLELEKFLTKHLARLFILDLEAINAVTKIANLSERNGRAVYYLWPKLLDSLRFLPANLERAKHFGLEPSELNFCTRELLVQCKFRRRLICFPVKLIMRPALAREVVRRLKDRGVIGQ